MLIGMVIIACFLGPGLAVLEVGVNFSPHELHSEGQTAQRITRSTIKMTKIDVGNDESPFLSHVIADPIKDNKDGDGAHGRRNTVSGVQGSRKSPLTDQVAPTANKRPLNISSSKSSLLSKTRHYPHGNGKGYPVTKKTIRYTVPTVPRGLCHPNPCKNGGVCFDDRVSFICKCREDYGGQYCEKSLNLCNPNPCRNGGTCFTSGSAIICMCPGIYDGRFCELPPAYTVVNQVVAQPVPGGHPEPLVKNPVALQGTNTMPLVLQMTKQQAGSVVSQPSDSMQSSVGQPIVVYGNYIPTAANPFGRKIVVSRQVLF